MQVELFLKLARIHLHGMVMIALNVETDGLVTIVTNVQLHGLGHQIVISVQMDTMGKVVEVQILVICSNFRILFSLFLHFRGSAAHCIH